MTTIQSLFRRKLARKRFLMRQGMKYRQLLNTFFLYEKRYIQLQIIEHLEFTKFIVIITDQNNSIQFNVLEVGREIVDR